MKSKLMKVKTIKMLLAVCLGVFGLFMPTNLHAQAGMNVIDLTGKIVDPAGESVIGANVMVKGEAVGTITDFDGKFKLSAPSDATLVISYIGYTTLEVPVRGKTFLEIRLQEDVELLEEVVVIGYGSVKKNDLTGSVSTISAKDMAQGLATSASDMLVGKTPGLTVTTDGGAPGSGAKMRIRGGSSLSASNDPLIVIDGVPVDNGGINGMANPLSTVNPSDIESFSVLKDASATAIYGSRASNGVIIITTKKGVAGAIKVSYNGSVSVNTKAKTLGVMNGDTFREYVTGKFGAGSDQANALGEYSTNWQKEIFRTTISTDHNASVSGSLGKYVPFRASLGYTKDNGILRGSDMDRWTGSLNLSPKFFDDHLSVQFNMRGIISKNNFADDGAISAATEFDPTQPVYDQTGSPYGNGYYMSLLSNGSPSDIGLANPLAILEQKTDKSKALRSIGNLQLDYKMHFLPELRANVNLGYDVSKSSGDRVYEDNSPMTYVWGNSKSGWGENEYYYQLKRNHLVEMYLQYEKTISKHKFDVLAGYSWQHFYRLDRTQYPYSQAMAEQTGNVYYKDPAGEIGTESYLISFFGRANYNYDNRYLMTFTLRNDGSSRFRKGNRWELYPSVAGAWRITEEKFMKDQDVLSDLKLRFGYGITGQQDVLQGDYPYLARYKYSEAGANYVFGDEVIQLVRPEKYDNNLKWEKTTTYNIGFDWGFLNNRISGGIDAYYRKTKDLLNEGPIPAGSNFGNRLLSNVGTLENKGIEFNVTGRAIDTKDWNWTINYNVAYNKNKITKLTDSSDPNYVGTIFGGIDGGTGTNVLINAKGRPHGSFYVYEQIYDKNGDPIEGAYVDQNGDGVVDQKDLKPYKSASPDVTMGFSSNLTYRNWDFSFAMHASIGNYAYNNVQSNREAYGGAVLYDPAGWLKNRMNSAIRTNFAAAQYQSSYYVQKANFLRMDNITLGYTFDKNMGFPKMPGTLRVYASVQNPFVITPYDGLDPEITNNGIDNKVYPRPRTFLLGLSYNF